LQVWTQRRRTRSRNRALQCPARDHRAGHVEAHSATAGERQGTSSAESAGALPPGCTVARPPQGPSARRGHVDRALRRPFCAARQAHRRNPNSGGGSVVKRRRTAKEDSQRLLRAWRNWHAEQLTEALTGLHRDVLERVTAQLKNLRSARELV